MKGEEDGGDGPPGTREAKVLEPAGDGELPGAPAALGLEKETASAESGFVYLERVPCWLVSISPCALEITNSGFRVEAGKRDPSACSTLSPSRAHPSLERGCEAEVSEGSLRLPLVLPLPLSGPQGARGLPLYLSLQVFWKVFFKALPLPLSCGS